MATRSSLRERGISESSRVQGPEPLLKKDESGERKVRVKDLVNILEFAAIVTSGFLFLSVFLIYNSAGEFFTQDSFMSFASNMLGITSLFIILGAIPLLYRIKEVLAYEILPAVIFLIGSLIIIFIPARIPFGVMPDSPLWSPVDIFLAVVGCVFIAISAYMSFYRKRYILTWYIGLITFIFVSAHELFHLVSWTGSFGPYDRALATLSLFLIFLGFILYILKLISDYILIRKLPKINDLINRAQAERKEGKKEDSLLHLRQCKGTYPWNPVAWNNMGNVYMDMEKEDKAEKCYKRALFINPQYEFALNNLGVLRRKQARFREAVKLLEKAVRIRPDYEAARKNLELAKSGEK